MRRAVQHIKHAGKCMHSCSSGIRQAALAMQLATLKFYEHHAVFKCEKGTDIIVKGTWHAD